MANKLYEETDIQDTANAIRTKTHRTSKFTVGNFAKEIQAIPQNSHRINNPFTPPELGYTNFDNAWEALKTAISYWNAKNSGTETFDYNDGNGALKGSTSAMLHDSNGNGIIDCSTFVGLVLRGLSYLESPYYNSSATTVDPRTVKCTNESWVEKYFDLQDNRYTGQLVFPTFKHKTNDNKYRVITASDMAQYYDKLGLFWYADNTTITPRAGDICFFIKENDDGTLKYPTRFHGISHVGFMTDNLYYLNATDYASSGDLIRTAVGSRPPFAYARPYYGALTDGVTNSLTANKVDLLPDVWSNVKQGSTTGANNCQFTLSGKTLVINGTGTGAAHNLLHSNCPLMLPAGTYKLSGVVNNTGGNTTTNHSYWGLRVYKWDGTGIAGKTWTSNGATVNNRNPVWDIGGSAEFTLTEETGIIIDLYLSKNKTFSNFTVTPKLYKIG